MVVAPKLKPEAAVVVAEPVVVAPKLKPEAAVVVAELVLAAPKLNPEAAVVVSEPVVAAPKLKPEAAVVVSEPVVAAPKLKPEAAVVVAPAALVFATPACKRKTSSFYKDITVVAHQHSCGKVMFSVESVCYSVHKRKGAVIDHMGTLETKSESVQCEHVLHSTM